MSYRYMRIIVMFDLPVTTASDRREYTRFRKYLIKNGFLMMQESVYCKLAQNSTAADLIVQNVKKNKPISGLVQTLRITEKQFSRMEYIVGEKTNEVLDSDERIVIL
ncbi:cRISPR-associated endoribonuclease Cas2 2 [Eubacterium sp. CAG:156]|nr:cRISPR-associated endoribonuclease Cas2 2 [Eubacterium sp. CAG:156]